MARQRLHLIALPPAPHRAPAQLPAASAAHGPVAALAFTSDSSRLVTATSANEVAVYDVASASLAQWSVDHPPASLPARLREMPGGVAGVAASPTVPSAVLVYSHQAVSALAICLF